MIFIKNNYPGEKRPCLSLYLGIIANLLLTLFCLLIYLNGCFKLGIYQDDWGLGPFRYVSLGGSPSAIFFDSFRQTCLTHRPLLGIAFAPLTMATAWGINGMHLFLFTCFLSSVITVYAFARTLVPESRVIPWLAALTFSVHPCIIIGTVWPTLQTYWVALTISHLSMTMAVMAARKENTNLAIAGAGLYIAGLLVVEYSLLGVVAFTLLAVWLRSSGRTNEPDRILGSTMVFRIYVAALAIYCVWRIFILPVYAEHSRSIPHQEFGPTFIVSQVTALLYMVIPWREMIVNAVTRGAFSYWVALGVAVGIVGSVWLLKKETPEANKTLVSSVSFLPWQV